MYLTMTSQTYIYAMLILNMVDVAPKKYICEEPTGGNGAFLSSVEENEIKHPVSHDVLIFYLITHSRAIGL